jgi:hypothetical protein
LGRHAMAVFEMEMRTSVPVSSARNRLLPAKSVEESVEGISTHT